MRFTHYFGQYLKKERLYVILNHAIASMLKILMQQYESRNDYFIFTNNTQSLLSGFSPII